MNPAHTSRLALVRAKLSLPTVRRASGVFDGRHGSVFTGQGIDFDDLVDYQHGDDVSDIDWSSSARMGHPIIRRFERESDVHTQVVVDIGKEMLATAPSGETKINIGLMAADVLAYLASQRGDRLGMTWGNSEATGRVPARHGTSHLEYCLDRVHRASHATSGTSVIDSLVAHVVTMTRQRSLMIVITDTAWPQTPDVVKRATYNHEVVLVRVADMDVTAPGVARMKDVDGGIDIPAYVRADKKLAQETYRYMQARMQHADSILSTYSVPNVIVPSSDSVPGALFGMLARLNHG